MFIITDTKATRRQALSLRLAVPSGREYIDSINLPSQSIVIRRQWRRFHTI
jgi:hypothetical protein